MDVQFFVCSDNPKKLNKRLGNYVSFNAQLKDDCSVREPILMTTISPLGYNYAYIPTFKRYYFIEDTPSFRNSVWYSKLRCDPLMSFNAEISSMTGILEKTGNYNIDLYIDDNTFRFENRITNDIKNFPYGFNENPDYILITAGGIA